MDRIEKVDKLFHQITELLPCIYDSEVDDEFKQEHFTTNPDGTQILSSLSEEVEAIANLFDELYGMGTTQTGYYDPDVDRLEDMVDAYTGLFYVSIA